MGGVYHLRKAGLHQHRRLARQDASHHAAILSALRRNLIDLRKHHALALAVTAHRMGDDGAAHHVVVLDQSQAPLAVTARTGDQAAAQQQEPLRRFGESP